VAARYAAGEVAGQDRPGSSLWFAYVADARRSGNAAGGARVVIALESPYF
jgi:hypothetical protein